jgi:hypothetical protein
MSCFYVSPYNAEREMPSIPYGTSSYYQEQPTTTGILPSMALPTGTPSGPPYGGTPLTTITPTTSSAIQTPQTVQSPYYTAGYLRKYIGSDVRVEFLIGTGGPLVDRIGVLTEVGASYIVLKPFRTNDTLMCDLYSIKFVTVYG